jgi:site-specific DNA recombinase
VAAVSGGDTDLSDSDALMVLRIKGSVAANEVEKIRRRVRRRHQQRAEDGLFHGGIRPFGYEPDGVTLRDHEAACVREAAERVLGGQSLHSIAADWNRRGVRTVRDRQWVGTTVKQTLLAPRVCGLRTHHGELRDAVWPAILDRGTWEDVRAVLTAPGRAWPTRSRSHPLRRILVCGECGRELYNGSSSHTRLYQCRSLRGGGCERTYVNADRVEEYVLGVLIPLLDSPAMRDAVRAEDAVTQEEVRRLVAENAGDQTRLAELDDMLADGEMDRPSYARASRRLRGRIDGRSARLSTVRGESVLDRLGGQVAERWPGMTDEERRTVLRAVVDSVAVSKGKGGGPFDPRRVRINFRTGAFERAARGLGYAGLAAWAEAYGPLTDEETEEALRINREAGR